MDRIKCITFNKEAQDGLPERVKEKMKADRAKAREESKQHGMERLKKGDKVVMHGCAEKALYSGKIWECRTDEQQLKDGDWVVWLEGYSGCFMAKYLAKVNIEK